MIATAMRRAVLLTITIMMVASSFAHVAAHQATPVATPTMSILNETPGNVPVSMLIRNLGPRDDVLLGASSPLADRVEVHHSRLNAGTSVMELATDGLALPAGSTRIFEPEGDHLMLIHTREALVQGDLFYLVLHFQDAGDVPVTGRVRRKLDAAGVMPIPPKIAGDLEISLVSAPPAPAANEP